ncbi:MAG: hypothetical protein HC848_02100 [Limnobacter sp.]|nr:hypothetical protein [Limnobacter sp.]
MIQELAKKGIAQGKWANLADCLDHLAARAKHENLPMESLFAPVLCGKIKDAIGNYYGGAQTNASVDSRKKELFATVSNIIDSTMSDATRRVSDLLFNSSVEAGPEKGTFHLQKQRIENDVYYLEINEAGKCHVCVESLFASGSDKEKLVSRYEVSPYQYATFNPAQIPASHAAELGQSVRKYHFAVPNPFELSEILQAADIEKN